MRAPLWLRPASQCSRHRAPRHAQNVPEKTGDGVHTGQSEHPDVQLRRRTSATAATPAREPDHDRRAAADGTSAHVAAEPARAAPTVRPRAAQCRANRLEALFALPAAEGRHQHRALRPRRLPGQTPTSPAWTPYRALLDKYGLHAGGRHGTHDRRRRQWTAPRRRRQDPRHGLHRLRRRPVPGRSAATTNTLRTAEASTASASSSVEAGVGPVYIHNHTGEFDAKYVDNGVLKTAWQILIERTDAALRRSPRSTPSGPRTRSTTRPAPRSPASSTSSRRASSCCTSRTASTSTTQPSPTNSRGGSPRAFGTGEVDYRPIFAAAKNRVQYYHQEHDGGTITDADVSFTQPQGSRRTASVPTVLGLPTSFPTVAAGTAAAENVVPVTITNTGDAPLTSPTSTLATGDNAGDFSSSAARAAATRASRTALPASRSPRALANGHPGRPARHLHRHRRLQADHARTPLGRPPAVHLERRRRDRAILLTGTSTGDAVGAVGGDRRLAAEPDARRAGELRRVHAGRRPHLRRRRRRDRRQHRRRRDAVGQRPERRPPRATWSTARSRCRSRCRSARPTRQPGTAYTPLSETAGTPTTCSPTPARRRVPTRDARLPPGHRRHRHAPLR